eukprot:TRINITY_DN5644_c1_g1_i5.p2 TRINITY_DN5644_c1_g1~~TRINITY_DN5644_c1_g1_i5.p2  ORF type:complete len:113 (-),score=33.14 TRINITY_DN5644_c1_g1_i5:32-370(-)
MFVLELADIGRELIFIIRSILILLSALIVLVSIFGSKIRAKVNESQSTPSSAGTVVSSSQENGGFGSNKDQEKESELAQLRTRLEKAQAKNKNYQVEIQDLKRKLGQYDGDL